LPPRRALFFPSHRKELDLGGADVLSYAYRAPADSQASRRNLPKSGGNMIDNISNIGEDVYRSWNEEQRRKEIGNLVQGFQNGLPIQILCQLATSIAGGSAQAKSHLAALMPLEERQAIFKKESGTSKELKALLKTTLL
jgi:hypothetical protein